MKETSLWVVQGLMSAVLAAVLLPLLMEPSSVGSASGRNLISIRFKHMAVSVRSARTHYRVC